MYNRYIRNDQGGYSRIPVDDDPTPAFSGAEHFGGNPPRDAREHDAPPRQEPQQENWPPPPRQESTHTASGKQSHKGDGGFFSGEGGRDGLGISAFLRKILDKFHLESVDTGDVILLLLLFFLFKEDADEELLFALGLMLIL